METSSSSSRLEMMTDSFQKCVRHGLRAPTLEVRHGAI
jgi:hypothetical protein